MTPPFPVRLGEKQRNTIGLMVLCPPSVIDCHLVASRTRIADANSCAGVYATPNERLVAAREPDEEKRSVPSSLMPLGKFGS
jgi:hypothetical protein